MPQNVPGMTQRGNIRSGTALTPPSQRTSGPMGPSVPFAARPQIDPIGVAANAPVTTAAEPSSLSKDAEERRKQREKTPNLTSFLGQLKAMGEQVKTELASAPPSDDPELAEYDPVEPEKAMRFAEMIRPGQAQRPGAMVEFITGRKVTKGKRGQTRADQAMAGDIPMTGSARAPGDRAGEGAPMGNVRGGSPAYQNMRGEGVAENAPMRQGALPRTSPDPMSRMGTPAGMITPSEAEAARRRPEAARGRPAPQESGGATGSAIAQAQDEIRRRRAQAARPGGYNAPGERTGSVEPGTNYVQQAVEGAFRGDMADVEREVRGGLGGPPSSARRPADMGGGPIGTPPPTPGAKPAPPQQPSTGGAAQAAEPAQPGTQAAPAPAQSGAGRTGAQMSRQAGTQGGRRGTGVGNQADQGGQAGGDAGSPMENAIRQRSRTADQMMSDPQGTVKRSGIDVDKTLSEIETLLGKEIPKGELSDQEKSEMIMQFGLNLMRSAGQPGATLFGAIGDAGLRTMQRADTLRQRSAKRQMQQRKQKLSGMKTRLQTGLSREERAAEAATAAADRQAEFTELMIKERGKNWRSQMGGENATALERNYNFYRRFFPKETALEKAESTGSVSERNLRASARDNWDDLDTFEQEQLAERMAERGDISDPNDMEAARQTFITSYLTDVGGAGGGGQRRTTGDGQGQTAQPPAAPQEGKTYTYGGAQWRFKGGDPSKQENWERAQ